MTAACDIIVVGAGIVGLATARELACSCDARVIVIEAEPRPATHQTGRNSGVIHSGLYYRPGSLKALNCAAGREALYAYCAEHGIAHARCGKLVVATDEAQLPALDELARRGHANGLTGVRRLDAAEIKEYEPEAGGLAALQVPQTGVVDFAEVARAFADDMHEAGGQLRLGAPVESITREGRDLVVRVGGESIVCRVLINCAGLQCDRVARLSGVRPDVRIVPFRGEYFALGEAARARVRGLIYPVPDPRYPFLGVHLTRMLDGRVEVGPNALLTLNRHGYARRPRPRARDVLETFSWPGFWLMGLKHWPAAVSEGWRSINRAAFVRELGRLLPGVTRGDLGEWRVGVRAQAVDLAGKLVDDFHLIERDGVIHVLNAPSPAATASIAIGRELAGRAREALEGA